MNRNQLLSLSGVLTVVILIVLAFYLGRQSGGVSVTGPSPSGAVSPITSPITSPSIPSPSAAEFDEVKIYFILIGDAGRGGDKIGCDDSVVESVRKITPSTMPLSAAINELLGIKTGNVGGFYNSLYQSDLKLESAEVKDGVAMVNLSGQLRLGGVCDNPRVEAQLTQTVMQFPTVRKSNIFINGKTLAEALSLK